MNQVANVTMGQSPDSKNYTENPTDSILVQGNADLKDGEVVPRVWTTQETKIAEPNSIILSVRAPVGDVGHTRYRVVLGRGVAGIKGNQFIYQILLKMHESGFWIKYSNGSTFESINSDDIKNADIYIPANSEQIKIGKVLKLLDQLIASNQRNQKSMGEGLVNTS